MAWRVARCLDQLLAQLNQLAPNRDKSSDGSIGDAAHASRDSDHNPWYGPGIVTARDFTHDPADGLDCQWLADTLVRSGDPRIKYIIWNRRIWQSNTGWKPYNGPNPHTKHLHLSAVASALCDDPRPWNLGTKDDDMALTDQDVDRIAKRVWEIAMKNGFGDTVAVIQILNGIETRLQAVQNARK